MSREIYTNSLSPVSPAVVPPEALPELLCLDKAGMPVAEARSSNRFYAPELDALRFAAFAGVFIFHARALLSDGLSPPLKGCCHM